MFIKCDTIKIRTNYKYLKEEKITFAPQYNFQHNKELGRYFNSKHNTQMPYNLYSVPALSIPRNFKSFYERI